MECMIYNSGIYCTQCGQEIRDNLDSSGFSPEDPDNEESYDSDEYPKGPFPVGESDCPQHCGNCNEFLQNPLTPTGIEYVRKEIKLCGDSFTNTTIREWKEFYSEELKSISLEYHHNDDFTIGYVECALWSSTDENGDPLDDNYGWGDIDHKSLKRMISDCVAFQEDNAGDLEDTDPARAGMDFWLTRNGHGAGFWDGDYPEEVGDRLTESAKIYGSQDLCVCDDEIYAF